ncbi:hypothetical protein K469DRAFT_737444 [Zopfia rhizophila CBS 207.26]|uniref:Uncharacterized protein n=1 Tax=Zopfia rhizophila CBS 207.26 TaxID=1314779 RepID=A0A6A6EA20_9PEZI|nr:hypothetical protein K469DRAFT_737444 [Zopfia rhizophila CBS 207.26]
MAGVKEQTASLYAKKRSEAGFTTVCFDATKQVGICAGGDDAVAAAKANYRLTAVATISMVNIGNSARLGWYDDESHSKPVETFKQAAAQIEPENNDDNIPYDLKEAHDYYLTLRAGSRWQTGKLDKAVGATKVVVPKGTHMYVYDKKFVGPAVKDVADLMKANLS